MFACCFADPESGLPDGNTAYRIGSISKVFTTLLALFYRDQGLWHLDDVVEKYIPHFSVVNPFRTRRGITLRQLASHMGGLSREAPCAGTYDNGCHDSDAVRFQKCLLHDFLSQISIIECVHLS